MNPLVLVVADAVSVPGVPSASPGTFGFFITLLALASVPSIESLSKILQGSFVLQATDKLSFMLFQFLLHLPGPRSSVSHRRRQLLRDRQQGSGSPPALQLPPRRVLARPASRQHQHRAFSRQQLLPLLCSCTVSCEPSSPVVFISSVRSLVLPVPAYSPYTELYLVRIPVLVAPLLDVHCSWTFIFEIKFIDFVATHDDNVTSHEWIHPANQQKRIKSHKVH